MTADAVGLKDFEPTRLHFDGLFEVLEREHFPVAPAVFGLCEVFGNELMGQMAIDADGRGVVARLLPAVVLALHDVTVHAGLGVGTEVRETARVLERVAPHSSQRPQSNRQQQRTPKCRR